MATFRKQITIEDPDHVVLSGLPFEPGQRVEITLTTDSSACPPLDALRSRSVPERESLFKTTQALPQAQAITEDEITAEIVAYRSGR
jgi:hypothetical protein